MSYLQLALKARAAPAINPVARLYRSVVKEIPKVLIIYDVDMPLPDARRAIRGHFDKYAHIGDDRVVDMLIEKGYMDLEETMLQHKQKTHLMRLLHGYNENQGAARKRLDPDSSIDEQFARA